MQLDYVSIILITIVIVAAFLAYRAYKTLATVKKFREYWQNHNTEAPKDGDLKILTLGDSVVQGVGASDIKYTFAGLVMDYVAKVSGRGVFLKNISVTGATVGQVLEKQLPQVEPSDFDIILLIASANDAFKDVPAEEYRRNLEALLSRLPKDKVLMADVPWVKRRSRYVPILHEVADKYGFTVISHDIDNQKSRLPFVYVAGDFLHPSDRGYREIWFNNFKPAIDERFKSLGYTRN